MNLFSITITIEKEDLDSMQRDGFLLSYFRQVQTESKNCMPIIWKTLSTVGEKMKVEFDGVNYQAFISTQPISPDEPMKVFPPFLKEANLKSPIVSSNSIAVNPPENVIIDIYGNLSKENCSSGEGIGIENQATMRFSVGLCQFPANVEANPGLLLPFCAQTLYQGIAKISPLPSILLVFTNLRNYKNSTYIKKLSNKGLLISCIENGTREVSYSIEGGWAANKQGWAKEIDAGIDLQKVLVKSAG